MKNKSNNFIDINDLSIKEIKEILELMQILKKAKNENAVPELLKNCTLAMIFEEPSTRTRISFESAMTLLGGHAQYLKPGEIHLGERESLYDTAKVISRLADGIMIRALKHETVTGMAKYADIPVINGLTDYNHPTQVFADIFTMIEHLPKEKKANFGSIKFVFIGDATNVCTTLAHITSKLGINFVHIGPKKYQLKKESLKISQENIDKIGNGSIKITEDINEVKDADIIYTDLWWWVDQIDEADERYQSFFPKYQVNSKLLKLAGNNCKVMHCLPCSRNIELSDQAFDSEQSIIFDQSENRLTAEMALLVYYIYPTIKNGINKKLQKEYQEKIINFVDQKRGKFIKKYRYNNDYEIKPKYLNGLKKNK